MNSKEARATDRLQCPPGHTEEEEGKIQEFFSPHNVKKRDTDNNNDRKGAIKAQKARSKEARTTNVEEESKQTNQNDST